MGVVSLNSPWIYARVWNTKDLTTKEMNKELHKQFVELGRERNKLTYTLLSLLPDIYNNGIYKKYCATIVEYAGKYGGLSKGVVKKTLRLEKHLDGKKLLKAAIAELGIHKINLVARVATKETEAVWLEKARSLSKSALEAAVREVRSGKVASTIRVKLSVKATTCFRSLKSKLEKGLTDEQALEQLLLELQEQKAEKKDKKLSVQKVILGSQIRTRYIPAAIKKAMPKLCVYKKCNREVEVLHHRERYAEGGSHESVVPLCDIHHQYAHNGMIKNEQKDPAEWKLQLSGNLTKADNLYNEYHMRR